ncbi:MAG: Txe/YoeB family addiction module toxin [Treponema sp.]|jgi:toxin YoeB|nr:Txe/YoeB family addiction module toxin [Treponema sp.]
MTIAFADIAAFNSFYEWTVEDKKTAKKIAELVRDIERDPEHGIGKPEPLKGNLAGHFSRRITDEHRLVYKVENNVIVITSCKGHYTGE